MDEVWGGYHRRENYDHRGVDGAHLPLRSALPDSPGGGGGERCGSFPLCNSAPTPHAPIVEKGLLRGAWWSRAGACSNGLSFSFT